MNRFLTDAQHIFDVASQSTEPEDLTIRIEPDGGIFVSACGGDMGGYLGTTYRVRRQQGQVVVEGRSGAKKCTLESASIRPILVDQPHYLLASC